VSGVSEYLELRTQPATRGRRLFIQADHIERRLERFMVSQRMVVSAPAGALGVVAIWKSIHACHAQVSGWSAHAAHSDGAESLALCVSATCAEDLQELITTLNACSCSMSAFVSAVTPLENGLARAVTGQSAQAE
jgi:hypothetical protein